MTPQQVQYKLTKELVKLGINIMLVYIYRNKLCSRRPNNSHFKYTRAIHMSFSFFLEKPLHQTGQKEDQRMSL